MCLIEYCITDHGATVKQQILSVHTMILCVLPVITTVLLDVGSNFSSLCCWGYYSSCWVAIKCPLRDTENVARLLLGKAADHRFKGEGKQSVPLDILATPATKLDGLEFLSMT